MSLAPNRLISEDRRQQNEATPGFILLVDAVPRSRHTEFIDVEADCGKLLNFLNLYCEEKPDIESAHLDISLKRQIELFVSNQNSVLLLSGLLLWNSIVFLF